MLKRLTNTICMLLFGCWIVGFGMVSWESSKNPHGPQENKPTYATEQKSQKDITDERIANYTLLLAWFTGILAVSTIGLWIVTWRGSAKQSRDMQESLRLTEKSLTELERPYLFVMDFNWLLAEQADVDGHKCGWHYFVANGGKLPAFVKNVRFGLRFGRTIPGMDDAVPGNELIVAPLIMGGEKRRIVAGLIVEDDDRPATKYQIRGGLARIPATAFDSGIIAKIAIEYDGPTTTGHITTACWEWHAVKYVFTQHGGSEHNQRT